MQFRFESEQANQITAVHYILLPLAPAQVTCSAIFFGYLLAAFFLRLKYIVEHTIAFCPYSNQILYGLKKGWRSAINLAMGLKVGCGWIGGTFLTYCQQNVLKGYISVKKQNWKVQFQLYETNRIRANTWDHADRCPSMICYIPPPVNKPLQLLPSNTWKGYGCYLRESSIQAFTNISTNWQTV